MSSLIALYISSYDLYLICRTICTGLREKFSGTDSSTSSMKNHLTILIIQKIIITVMIIQDFGGVVFIPGEGGIES